ncbi:carbon storage regulator CsrA [Cognatiluteimonas profundi]|uniref:carbon storage regulator CsrA n=1 Tax=Cognatiluteimonas profundi TaxID=2594501 RepID=UPI00131B4C15|nr:carbon storage regulator CsrA [Lysobacter profundi]
MLILTRKEGETIAIGNEITVTVIAVQGGQIKLGIQAPMDVPVHREEVWQRLNASVAA